MGPQLRIAFTVPVTVKLYDVDRYVNCQKTRHSNIKTRRRKHRNAYVVRVNGYVQRTRALFEGYDYRVCLFNTRAVLNYRLYHIIGGDAS